MPRRKTIPSTSSVTASPSVKSSPLKRPRADSNGHPNSTPPFRQSSRLKSSPLAALTATQKTTPKKSQFFHQDSLTSEPASETEDEASGYEDEDATASARSSTTHSDSDSGSEAEPSSDDEAPRKKRRVGGKKGAAVKKVEVKVDEDGAVVGSKGQELWRPGVKSKLAPGEAVFVPLPKAREEGKIKYRDDWIHGNTMLFLGELKKNNDREWLKIHDADYRQSKKDFDSFVECLTEKLIEKDETIPELPPKDLVCHLS